MAPLCDSCRVRYCRAQTEYLKRFLFQGGLLDDAFVECDGYELQFYHGIEGVAA